MRGRHLPCLAYLLALWPVWHWYALRMIESTPERGEIVALVTALLFIRRTRVRNEERVGNLPVLPTALLVLYGISFHLVPPLIRAILGFTALGSLWSSRFLGRRFHPGLWGLLMLSLPVLSSLQFYFGYPLRVACGAITAPLLQLAGYPVVRQGTCLEWNGSLLAIDAPCSGIRMLWVGMYLGLTLACLRGMTAVRTAAVCGSVLAIVLAGNAFRAAGLFFSEAVVAPLPSWTHGGIGVATFLFIGLAIAGVVQRMTGEKRCAASLPA